MRATIRLTKNVHASQLIIIVIVNIEHSRKSHVQ